MASPRPSDLHGTEEPVGGKDRTSSAPLLSIIVPNYNHAPFLEERLNSIKHQSFRNYELIVLDDASSDDSLSVLQHELQGWQHQLVVNSHNSGSPCSQWLKGIALARGDFIWIAESDDSCAPDFLASLIPHLEQGACLAYCRSAAIDATGADISASTLYWPDQLDRHLWHQPFTTSSHDFCQRLMSRANCIPNASAVVFRRESALACLAIKAELQDLLFCGDWIFWFHYLAQGNQPICFDPQPRSRFRCHAATTRANHGSPQRHARHIDEYCRAARWICAQPLLTPSRPWRQRLWDGQWDWMLLEYLVRIRPGPLQILLGLGLHGPLRSLMPRRLLLSRLVRSQAFPRLGGWINRRQSSWQTQQARLLARLRRRQA